MDAEAPAGRSRRANAGRGRTGAAARSALEELRALKEGGGKRASTYELKEAGAVYDVVDEREYGEIVAKRRAQYGGFVEDDVGAGYADIGEEDDWSVPEAEQEAQNELPQKRKGKEAKESKRSKAKTGSAFDPEGRKKMQSMLMAGASSAKPSKPVSNEESDDLLNDILSGLGGTDRATPITSAPATATVAAPRHHRPAPPPRGGFSRLPKATPSRAPISRAPAASASASAAAVAVAMARPPKTFARPTARAPPSPIPPAEEDHEDLKVLDFDASAYDAAPAEDQEGPQVQPHLQSKAVVQLQETHVVAPEAEVEGGDAEEMMAALEDDLEEDNMDTTAEEAKPKGRGAVFEEEAEVAGASGWAALCREEDEPMEDDTEESTEDQQEGEAADMAVDSEETPFFVIDVHEELSQTGSVYLFGKVPVESKYVSACCVVKDMVRSLTVVPREGVLSDPTGRLEELQELAKKDPGANKRDLMIHLQTLARDLKQELKEVLARQRITKTTISVVQRSYAFEEPGVPHGQQWVLKIKYPSSQGQVPPGLSGRLFAGLFGATTSLAETLIVKRKIMGPSWVSLKNARKVDSYQQVSWCAVELEVSGYKAVVTSGDVCNRAVPPLVVASLHVQTHINPTSHANEVVAASVVSLNNVKIDGPTTKAEWNNPKHLRHFSILRKLDSNPWPVGFQAKVDAANSSPLGKRNSQGGQMISAQSGERALLTYLMARLRSLDADVFVGHNIAGFDVDVLLHRMQHHKVPTWSSLGRLKRQKFPNLSGGGNVFGGGASHGALTALAGRLLCDTYLAAREIVKEVDYTLSTLSRSLLGQQRAELPSGGVAKAFQGADTLMNLADHTNSDAWLSLGLMFHLSVLPLTRQLTCLSGFQWSRTLSGARAQRIEMLLLHEFHARKFITPDKLSNKDKARLEKSRAGGDGHGAAEGGGGKKSKGPQYAGGLVLEPKKGLYDKYVLLLDFNSLYPSIIQEYNICFTTVVRPEDGGPAPLPESTEEIAPLPWVIRNLVQRRRQVKELVKKEADPVKKEQLNIRQQALKLTANSMYGCLGFSNSRFYCKPLAELITSQGREILQSTVDLVERSVGLEIIYGDTDSIMINTATDNLPDVWKMGQAVKKEVNKRYRLLEIEVDGVYKSMLLLKKKKYAAIKVELLPSGEVKQEMEQKGLDIVRRDWCPLSKDCGNFALKQILSGARQEDVVDAIHANMREVKDTVASGAVPINKFVITKQLTKQPEDYPDAKNQPHVQVAIRRKAAGKRNGVAAGETVPYIICVEQKTNQDGAAVPDTRPLAERAYHPEELRASETLSVDAEYYLGQQVHPVVSRLCGPIEGTDPGHLANSLGLDPSRYRGSSQHTSGTNELREELSSLAGGSLLDDADTYKDCEPLMLSTADGTRFRLPAAEDVASGSIEASAALRPTPQATPLTPAQLSNQAVLAARMAISAYYAAPARSDDDVAPVETHDVSLRVIGASPLGSLPADSSSTSGATMVRTSTEAQLYTQLTHFHRLLDTSGAVRRLTAKQTPPAPDATAEAEHKLSPLRRAYTTAAGAVARFRDRCLYKWVDLGSIYGTPQAVPAA